MNEWYPVPLLALSIAAGRTHQRVLASLQPGRDATHGGLIAQRRRHGVEQGRHSRSVLGVCRDMYEQGTKEVECIVKILLLIARSVACNYRCRSRHARVRSHVKYQVSSVKREVSVLTNGGPPMRLVPVFSF